MSRARPSRTAMKIARFMLLLDAVPRFDGLLPAGAARTAEAILSASGAVRRRELDMMRRPWVQAMYGALEGLLGRGQLPWFGLRKRWFADAVAQAIAAGATQLLVVGAGFDPLAAIIARQHPEVLCVEVDAPATAEPKRAGLRGAGLLRDNLEVCAADLASRPLAEALAETRWTPAARSVVVAEGLLMYLDAAAVAGFLAAVRAIAAPGSRLACSSVDADDAGEPRFGSLGLLDRAIRASLRLAGEPIRWGIQAPAVPAFAAAAGYRVLDQPDLAALRRRYLDPIGLHGEPITPYEHLILLETT